MKTRHPVRSMRNQRGLVAVIVTLAMMSFLGVVALAVDINHAYMNRTKLQSSVDSAALAAAVILDQSGSDDEATSIAQQTLSKMAESTGNSEFDFSSATVSITFSNDPSDFSASYDAAADDRYVRVAVSNLSLASFFIQVFGIDKKLSASAVAGRSAGATTVCNVVPMGICALDPSQKGIDPLTGKYLVGGYTTNDVFAVKMVSNESDMGPGNFQLLDLDGSDDDSTDKNTKEDHIKYQLAGTYQACVDLSSQVSTKPGNTIGPTADGLNTRFNDSINGKVKFYSPDEDFKEANLTSEQVATVNDPNTTLSADDLDYSYSNYTGNNRRVLAVPILDCTESGSGKTTFPVVSVGCYFLLQKVDNGNADKKPVFGEFIKECVSENSSNNGTSSSLGPYRIVLYDDPSNKGS